MVISLLVRVRDVCSSLVSPLVSGGGPLSECSLCLLHGRESTLCGPHSIVEDDDRDAGNIVRCHIDLYSCCHGSDGIWRVAFPQWKCSAIGFIQS